MWYQITIEDIIAIQTKPDETQEQLQTEESQHEQRSTLRAELEAMFK